MWPIFKAHFAIMRLEDGYFLRAVRSYKCRLSNIVVIGVDRKLNGYSIKNIGSYYSWAFSIFQCLDCGGLPKAPNSPRGTGAEVNTLQPPGLK